MEKLGLKAVGQGASPTKLQQAFASAQLNGNWSYLVKEIEAVLGPDSIVKKSGTSDSSQSTYSTTTVTRPVVSSSSSNTPGTSTVVVQRYVRICLHYVTKPCDIGHMTL